MTALLKAIQAQRRKLGLEDGDYRAMLERVTGKRSAADLDSNERRAVLAEFDRLGGRAERQLTGPFAGKLVALWLSAWNLGIVSSRHDSALIAFVERQTGLGHLNWLRDARQASRAIEGLKAWIARESGVEWPVSQDAEEAKRAVIAAQCHKLGEAVRGQEDGLDATIAALGVRIRKAKAK